MIGNFRSTRPQASPPRSPLEQRRKVGNALIAVAVSALVSRSSVTNFLDVEFNDERAVRRLWRRLKKRLGLSRVREDNPVRIIKLLSLVHHGCLKSAANQSYIKQLFPRFTIRTPVPWHQQFLIAKEYCSYNLFMTHPVMVEIRRSWTRKYSTCSLFEASWNRTNTIPLSPHQLLQHIQNRSTELKESLTNAYV